MIAKDLLILIWGGYEPPPRTYLLLGEYHVLIRGDDRAHLAGQFQEITADLRSADSLALLALLNTLLRTGGVFKDYAEDSALLEVAEGVAYHPLVGQEGVEVSQAAWLGAEAHAQDGAVLWERRARLYRGVPGRAHGVVELALEPHQREGEGR